MVLALDFAALLMRDFLLRVEVYKARKTRLERNNRNRASDPRHVNINDMESC